MSRLHRRPKPGWPNLGDGTRRPRCFLGLAKWLRREAGTRFPHRWDPSRTRFYPGRQTPRLRQRQGPASTRWIGWRRACRDWTPAPKSRPWPASADGKTVTAWTGELVRCYELAGDRLKERSAIRATNLSSLVVFSPDLLTFAGVDENNNVRWLDSATGKERLQLEDAGPTVAFRADGKMLATLTAGGTLRRVKSGWTQATKCKPVFRCRLAPAGVGWAVFAPDLQSLVCAHRRNGAVVGLDRDRAADAWISARSQANGCMLWPLPRTGGPSRSAECFHRRTGNREAKMAAWNFGT